MLKTPSTIAKIETMADRGMKLTVHTQELTPQDKAELMNLHNKIGWFVFSAQMASTRSKFLECLLRSDLKSLRIAN